MARADLSRRAAPGPLGHLLTWTSATLPSDYVLANGQRLARADYPDAYSFAQANDGNGLWTVRTSDQTFTVPNLSDSFLYGTGALTLGTRGGAQNHAHTINDHSHGVPDHSHAVGTLSVNGHTHGISSDLGMFARVTGASSGAIYTPSTGTSGTGQHNHGGGTGSAGAGISGSTAGSGGMTSGGVSDRGMNTVSHMPPHVAVAIIVRVKAS